jgi:hypothetical protein
LDEVTVRLTGPGIYQRISEVGRSLTWLELTPSERREISDREWKAGVTEAFEPENFFA